MRDSVCLSLRTPTRMHGWRNGVMRSAIALTPLACSRQVLAPKSRLLRRPWFWTVPLDVAPRVGGTPAGRCLWSFSTHSGPLSLLQLPSCPAGHADTLVRNKPRWIRRRWRVNSQRRKQICMRARRSICVAKRRWFWPKNDSPEPRHLFYLSLLPPPPRPRLHCLFLLLLRSLLEILALFCFPSLSPRGGYSVINCCCGQPTFQATEKNLRESGLLCAERHYTHAAVNQYGL